MEVNDQIYTQGDKLQATPTLASLPMWVVGSLREVRTKDKEQMFREKVTLALRIDVSGGDGRGQG